MVSLAVVFLVTLIFTGFDISSAGVVMFIILLTLVNLIGLMQFLGKKVQEESVLGPLEMIFPCRNHPQRHLVDELGHVHRYRGRVLVSHCQVLISVTRFCFSGFNFLSF